MATPGRRRATALGLCLLARCGGSSGPSNPAGPTQSTQETPLAATLVFTQSPIDVAPIEFGLLIVEMTNDEMIRAEAFPGDQPLDVAF